MALGPRQSSRFPDGNAPLLEGAKERYSKETMPSYAPTAQASSLDFATIVAKRPRRPGAFMRPRRMNQFQVPLRDPFLIFIHPQQCHEGPCRPAAHPQALTRWLKEDVRHSPQSYRHRRRRGAQPSGRFTPDSEGVRRQSRTGSRRGTASQASSPCRDSGRDSCHSRVEQHLESLHGNHG